MQIKILFLLQLLLAPIVATHYTNSDIEKAESYLKANIDQDIDITKITFVNMAGEQIQRKGSFIFSENIRPVDLNNVCQKYIDSDKHLVELYPQIGESRFVNLIYDGDNQFTVVNGRDRFSEIIEQASQIYTKLSAFEKKYLLPNGEYHQERKSENAKAEFKSIIYDPDFIKNLEILSDDRFFPIKVEMAERFSQMVGNLQRCIPKYKYFSEMLKLIEKVTKTKFMWNENILQLETKNQYRNLFFFEEEKTDNFIRFKIEGIPDYYRNDYYDVEFPDILYLEIKSTELPNQVLGKSKLISLKDQRGELWTNLLAKIINKENYYQIVIL